ncbi:homogentisate 1,2-dioxygenase [Phenylobacterium sp.]|uniref:homogentisate 1,2-dioxygenase n=1 Tax=Phenylobacterium sp. TaxID=1871053 RepID=UPI0025D3976F|nr:homogentisate 1,2-dioxygenase [Phenylobacterium sp.]MBX3483225.1 homogentisate 1,2-dioxygenase [Phenylobacterium sp.]MCW5759455.1 homogentisate 1,2-dioxygenase [Phenylobacterium sp.]
MRLIFVLAALALAAPAAAQEAAPVCPADAKPIPGHLAGWTHPAPLAAAASAADAGKAALMVGQAADAALPSTGDVKFALRPEKPGGSVSHGGVFSVDIDKPGAYTVALSTGAWIDVVRDGKALESSAHGRGPACTSLRKMVQFQMQPGRYLIQISANAEPRIGIMVAANP